MMYKQLILKKWGQSIAQERAWLMLATQESRLYSIAKSRRNLSKPICPSLNASYDAGHGFWRLCTAGSFRSGLFLLL